MSLDTKKVQEWVEALEFKKIHNKNIWELIIQDSIVKVDFDKKKIIYPNNIEIGRTTTINFSAEENLVVLDIVVNLLKQGYKEDNIVIEKAYQLGRNKKSGNADVTVHNNQMDVFMIIEAKTYGDEFENAWEKTKKDGDQLFSYERQENSAEVLILYTSTMQEKDIIRYYHAIPLKDNGKFLDTLENPKSYNAAKGGNDKFEVWRDTYQLDSLENGVLELDIRPYHVNKSRKSVKDLSDITHDEVQRKYNEFASILRKYNIGGRENAFDKLVNLFLAKIVDEEQNPDDLQFVWKGVTQDTYFDLVDRLQKLYQIGMQKFLDESVTYVAEEDVSKAFSLTKDAAKDAVLDYFKQLKYFSNSDFAFLEVYNEQLFYQNSKVLVELIKMFQNKNLKTESQNQFLGDLFEGFLDNGVKQSEGQYFTPIPIVKFIVSSLPLEQTGESPKVIDYACGAGHFLNEFAEQIKSMSVNSSNTDLYSNIYGIEKEYRLSKVAKVSAFMYGQDDIRIIYGDGLKKHSEIEEESFDYVIANPPYSVKGFLTTLSLSEQDSFELNKYVSNTYTFNSIEYFFIEKAYKLLKHGGIASIILPVSILSNGFVVDIEIRKFILRKFDIVSIVQLGSKTFGSTGQNTIVLYLKKKDYPPNISDHYLYSVERWFNNENVQKDDTELVKQYCYDLEIDYESFCALQQDNNDLKPLLKFDIFNEYKMTFYKSAEYKNIDRKKITTKYTKEMKDASELFALRNYIIEVEKEKVFYHALTYNQKQKVIVVKSPSKLAEIKKFLGYDWSTRRGQEGIKYLGTTLSDEEMDVSKNQAINNIKTPLFNPVDLDDPTKINTLIKKNFKDEELEISEENKEYVSILNATDLLNFKKTSFSAQFKTTKSKFIKSIYPIKALGSLVDVKIGGTPSTSNNDYYVGDNLWAQISEMKSDIINDTNSKISDLAVKESNVKLIPKGTTLISFKLSIGKVAKAGKDLYTNEAIAGLVPLEDDIKDDYLFALFDSGMVILDDGTSKSFGNSLNSKFLRDEVLIPHPPLEIQDKIIKIFNDITKNINNKKDLIIENDKEIKMLLENLQRNELESYRLSSDLFELNIGRRVLKSQYTEEGIPIYSANVMESSALINDDIVKDFSKPSVLWGIDGDWNVSYLPENQKFYPTDHAGYIRLNTNEIDYRYLSHVLYEAGIQEGFSRSNRASTDKIRNLILSFPDYSKQNQTMNKIDKIKEKTTQLNNEIQVLLSDRKREIINILK